MTDISKTDETAENSADIWLCFVLKVRKMWGLMLPQGPVYQRSVRLKIKLLQKPFYILETQCISYISETQHISYISGTQCISYISETQFFLYFRNSTHFLYFRKHSFQYFRGCHTEIGDVNKDTGIKNGKHFWLCQGYFQKVPELKSWMWAHLGQVDLKFGRQVFCRGKEVFACSQMLPFVSPISCHPPCLVASHNLRNTGGKMWEIHLT